MKCLALIFPLFAFLSGCSHSEEIRYSDQSNQLIEKPSSTPILEITQDAKGMWTIVGKTLFFRLYDNRVVEMEFADDSKRAELETIDATEVNQMTRVKLTEAEFQKLTDLINGADLAKISEQYQRKCFITDAILNFAVNLEKAGNTKAISLNGVCGVSELKASQRKDFSDVSQVPQVILDLIVLTDEYRRKYNSSAKSPNHQK